MSESTENWELVKILLDGKQMSRNSNGKTHLLLDEPDFQYLNTRFNVWRKTFILRFETQNQV